MKSQRGSALLVTVLLSAIMLAALGALLTATLNEHRNSLHSYLGTAAFSLAESGIDRAAVAIASKTVLGAATEVSAWPAEGSGVTGWYKKTGTKVYRGYFATDDLGNGRRGSCSVVCTALGTDLYEVYSRGTAVGGPNRGLVAERALQVRLSQSSVSSFGLGYALAAVTEIKLATATTPVFKMGDTTGFPRIASYDSSKGVPNLWTDIVGAGASGRLEGTNVGGDAMIAVKTGTLDLQNAIIYGKVATAPGAAIKTNTYSENRKEIFGPTGEAKDNDKITIKTAVLVNPEVAKSGAEGVWRGYNFDALGAEMDAYDQAKSYSDAELTKVSKSCVLTNYTFEEGVFDVPELAQMGGYGDGKARTTDVADAAITQNTKVLTLDASTATYYTNSDGQAFNEVTNIAVKGTVLLYAPRDFKAESGLTITYADSSSKLILYSDGAVRVTMASCPTYRDTDGTLKEIAPKQFEINVGNGSDIDIKCNTGVFAGVVKAPRSQIEITTSGDGSGRNAATAALQMAGRLQLRGQFIANVINLSGSNNVDILYDVQTKGSGTTTSAIKVDSWKQIHPSKFIAQL